MPTFDKLPEYILKKNHINPTLHIWHHTTLGNKVTLFQELLLEKNEQYPGTDEKEVIKMLLQYRLLRRTEIVPLISEQKKQQLWWMSIRQSKRSIAYVGNIFYTDPKKLSMSGGILLMSASIWLAGSTLLPAETSNTLYSLIHDKKVIALLML